MSISKKCVGILYQMSADETARAEYEAHEKANVERATEIENFKNQNLQKCKNP